MNMIDWFRNEFIPNANDETISQLIFVYEKYCNPNYIDNSELEFIRELTQKYKNTKIG